MDQKDFWSIDRIKIPLLNIRFSNYGVQNAFGLFQVVQWLPLCCDCHVYVLVCRFTHVVSTGAAGYSAYYQPNNPHTMYVPAQSAGPSAPQDVSVLHITKSFFFKMLVLGQILRDDVLSMSHVCSLLLWSLLFEAVLKGGRYWLFLMLCYLAPCLLGSHTCVFRLVCKSARFTTACVSYF